MKPEVISEKPVSCYEVKKILKAVEKRDTELSFRSNRTKEYVGMFSDLTDKQAADLTKELNDLNIPRLKDVHIVKLVDVMPVNEEDVKGVLSGYNLSLKADYIKSIADTFAKHRKE